MTKNNPEANDFMPDNEPIDEAALRGNSNFDSTMDASEWRDPFAKNLATPETTQFATTMHAVGEVPVDSRKLAIAERRDYANQSDIESPELTMEVAARRYSSFSVLAPESTTPLLYPGDPVMLLGDDRSRVRTVFTNGHATDSVVIGHYDQVTTGNGFLLPPGVVFESIVTEAVYACIPARGSNSITVGVWAEYA